MSQLSIPATTNRVYKIAVWFEGEQQFDLLPFIFFVTSANCAQQSFQCHSACNFDPLSRGIGVQN
jgi:hypothetical protein